jgi:hypothetical protein
MALDRWRDVTESVRRAAALRPDLVSLRRFAYLAALVAGDAAAMSRELQEARRLPDAVMASDWEARAAAFAGRVQLAHERYRRAVEAATQAQLDEIAAQWSAGDAETHALVGQCAETRGETAAALALSRDNFTLERSGRALALCGARAEVSKLSGELVDRFPEATLTHRVQVPVMAAALALHGGDAARAIALLEPVAPYDRARGAEFWPSYLRGRANLASRNGAAAAKAFDSILSHRGEAPDSPVYVMARLGAARAAAMNGDTSKARQAYSDFLAAWADADPTLQPLQDARAERAALR